MRELFTCKRYYKFGDEPTYIGYKSAHHQTSNWWKDTKDKEATLIYILPFLIKSLVLALRRSICSNQT